MSADISELIEQIRAGLEGTTDGPWSLGVGLRGELFLTKPYSRDDYDRVSGEFAKDEDAEHAALCDPQAIRRLLDHIAELRSAAGQAMDIYQADDERDIGEAMFMVLHAALNPSSPKGGPDHG